MCLNGDATTCRLATPEEIAAYKAKGDIVESEMCTSFPATCGTQAMNEAKAADAEADNEARVEWAKEQRLGAIAYGAAQAACKAVTEDEIISAYNAQHFRYLGHPITFVSAGGAVADPRNALVGNGSGAKSPYGAICSAFAQAQTTDGTGLSVVAPLSFDLSASGDRIGAVSIQP